MSTVVTSITAHLPAIQIVLPLVSAPICMLLSRPRWAWAAALSVSAVSLLISVLLAAAVAEQGEIRYLLGGWAAPWGIEYRIDALNAMLLVIITGASALALVHARESVDREVAEDKRAMLYTAWLLCLTGLLGMSITGDAFNVFVFLEISSLSTYLLVALGPRRDALTASFRYLIIGTVGATFFLIGVGLLYMMTGTLNMADLSERLVDVRDTGTVRAAVAFLVIGLAAKAALFPMHAWLPGAYAEAPGAVTAFLAGSATKVAIYVLARFLFTVFGADALFSEMYLDRILMPLALAGILVGSAVATYQGDAKRLLAWSSIAQVGYMVLGLGLASVAGLTASFAHLFNHALMKAALFLAVANIGYRIGSANIGSFKGLGRTMPWTMGCFLVAAMSLIGVPLTAGFISKWYLLTAALSAGLWPVALVVVVSSLLAVIYMWRVVRPAYFESPVPGSIQANVKEAPWSMLAPLLALAAANLYFGLDTSFSIGFARTAAAELLGVAP